MHKNNNPTNIFTRRMINDVINLLANPSKPIETYIWIIIIIIIIIIHKIILNSKQFNF